MTASSRDKSALVHGNNHGNVISTKAGFCFQRFNNQSQLAIIYISCVKGALRVARTRENDTDVTAFASFRETRL